MEVLYFVEKCMYGIIEFLSGLYEEKTHILLFDRKSNQIRNKDRSEK